MGTWPRGDRPTALREAGGAFRRRFSEQGEVRAIRTVDLVSAAYPVAYAFHGAARAVNPYLNILNRLVVIQFEDFAGAARTLVWEPTIPEGSAEAPFYAQLLAASARGGQPFAKIEFNTLQSALASVGLRRDDVDYLSFDHLHVQDVRMHGRRQPIRRERADLPATRSSSSNGASSTPSAPSTRPSGPGTSRAGWTASTTTG